MLARLNDDVVSAVRVVEVHDPGDDQHHTLTRFRVDAVGGLGPMMQITVMVPGSSPMGVVSVTLIFTAPPQKLGGKITSPSGKWTIPQP